MNAPTWITASLLAALAMPAAALAQQQSGTVGRGAPEDVFLEVTQGTDGLALSADEFHFALGGYYRFNLICPAAGVENEAGLSFSAPEFRASLAMFATGVTIVTARTESGALVGLTANSFNSVSLDPPLVLWSLASAAGSMPVLSTGSHYAINILAADQRELAERFATRDVDRWRDVPWTQGRGGAPLLDGAAATFECFNRSRYAEGDHVIFVGEVLHANYDPAGSPLAFFRGGYAKLS